MGSTVDWKNVGEGTNNKGIARKQRNYLKINSKDKVRIRPVGHAIEITKVFHEHDGRFRVINVNHRTEEGQEILQKLDSEYNIQGQRKFVYAVLDRSEDTLEKSLKIYEGPKGVFQAFGAWASDEGKEPGGPEGCDFTITPNGKEGKDRRYTVMNKEASPFTPEEKAFLKLHLLGDKENDIEADYDVEQIYKSVSPDEVNKILFDEGVETETSANPSGVEAAAKSASDDDDEDLTF